MNKIKRIISLALVMCLCLPFIPFTVVTADGESSDGTVFFESFEYPATKTSPPDKWEIYTGTASYRFDDKTPSDGKSYAVITDDSDTKGAGFRMKPIPATPGQAYSAYVDAWVLDGSGGELYLEFWNNSGKRVGVKVFNGAGNGEWKTISGIGIAPDDTATMTLLLYSGGKAMGTVAYDKAVIKTVTEDDNVEKFVTKEKSHPRLYFTEKELSDFKERANDTEVMYNGRSMAAYTSDIITSAEKYIIEKDFSISYYGGHTLTFNVPTDMPGKLANPPKYGGSDQYPYWTALTRQIETRMKTLAVAYVLTEKKEYADMALKWLRKVVTWTAWSDPYYGSGSTCLDTAHMTYGVCAVYDLLYDFLTEDDKKATEKALINYAMSKLYIDIHSKSPDNGQMLRCAALMTACSTIYESNEIKCSVYLHKALEFFNWFMDSGLTSANHEGLMYTSYGVEYMIVALDHYARTFGDMSVIEHKYLSEFLMEWIVTGAENSKGLSVNIADCSPSTGNFFITASTMYRLTKNPLAAYYLVRNKSSSSGLDALIYTCNKVEAQLPSDDYLTFNIPVIGWGIFRPSWKASDPVLFANSSGSKMGHCHYDANSFVLAMNGAWLASDPGYHSFDGGAESLYGTTGGHNTIFIDGKGQTSLGGGSLKEKLTSPFFAISEGDASSAYPKALGLSRFARTYVMVGFGMPYFIIRDELRASEQHEYTWRLNINGFSSQSVNSDKRNISVVYNGASVGINFAFDDKLNIKYGQYETTLHPIIDVTNANKTKEQEYLAVITPYIPANGKIEFKNFADTFELVGKTATAKVAHVDIFDTLLVRDASIGDSVSVPIDIIASGNYTVKLRYLTGKSYGGADVYIGGTKVGSFDGYRDGYVDFDTVSFENVTLEKGNYDLKFVWNESAAGEAADKLGLVHIELNTDVEILQTAEVRSSYRDEDLSYASVTYGDGTKLDHILFNNKKANASHTDSASSVTLEGDGEFLGIFGDDGEGYDGYILSGGTSLSYNGAVIATSTKAADISVNFNGQAVITADASADVVITLPKDAKDIMFAGNEVALSENSTVTLSVSKGKNILTFTSASNEDAEDEEKPSEGSGNTVIIVIIVIAVIAVAGAGIFFATKKKK